jgi:hypothetical protein
MLDYGRCTKVDSSAVPQIINDSVIPQYFFGPNKNQYDLEMCEARDNCTGMTCSD